MSDQDSDAASESKDPFLAVQRGKRHHHRDPAVDQSLEMWTPTFLAEKQGEDCDLALVKSWLESSEPPDWNEV